MLVITHPYHPLNGKSYDILRVTTISGVRHYFLQADGGTLCVPETWTDRYISPCLQSETTDVPFDSRHLAELADLLKNIKKLSENSPRTIDGFNL